MILWTPRMEYDFLAPLQPIHAPYTWSLHLNRPCNLKHIRRMQSMRLGVPPSLLGLNLAVKFISFPHMACFVIHNREFCDCDHDYSEIQRDFMWPSYACENDMNIYLTLDMPDYFEERRCRNEPLRISCIVDVSNFYLKAFKPLLGQGLYIFC